MRISAAPPPQDCRWTIDGLDLAGLAWGPEDGTPVLALHGWMDHAGSFQELAPRLEGCRVVALDLSGQGLSSHRAAHASYNIWDDLPQISALLDLLGWDRPVLIGHSRGASIGTLFAAAQPHRVRAFVALDALAPTFEKDEAVVEMMRSFIDIARQQQKTAPRRYKTKEAFVNHRTRQRNSRQTAKALADRALVAERHGFRNRADARLSVSSVLKLTRAQVEALLASLEMPVLNIWARDGIQTYMPWFREMRYAALKLIRTYETLEFPGDHHFHLDPATSDEIAATVLGFLRRHGATAADK